MLPTLLSLTKSLSGLGLSTEHGPGKQFWGSAGVNGVGRQSRHRCSGGDRKGRAPLGVPAAVVSILSGDPEMEDGAVSVQDEGLTAVPPGASGP